VLPTRRDGRGSATDRHGFVISSNTDGAMYVKPCNNMSIIIFNNHQQKDIQIQTKLFFSHIQSSIHFLLPDTAKEISFLTICV